MEELAHKYDGENKICGSLDVPNIKQEPKEYLEERDIESKFVCSSLDKSIKMELDENDDEQLVDINKFKLIKTDIKEEYESSEDTRLVKLEESEVINSIGLKREVEEEMVDYNDMKIDIEDPIISTKTLDIDCNDSNFTEKVTYTINMRYENDTVHSRSKNQHTRNGFRFKCTQCTYASNRKCHFGQHLRMHNQHSVEKFSCDQCNFTTIYKSNLFKHKKLHNANKSFQCKICLEEFNIRSSFTFHMNNVHLSGEKVIELFKCGDCLYNTENKAHFAAHILKHGEKTKYVCPDCDYSTQYRSNLGKHFLTHVEGKPFICEQCDYTTTTNINLKKHIKTSHQNLNNRRYKCEQCNYASDSKGHFNLHMVTHRQDIAEKLFCYLCAYSTIDKRKLARHFKTTHRNILCKICQKYFKGKHDIKAHMKTHHVDTNMQIEAEAESL